MKNKIYYCYRMGERLAVVDTYIKAKNTCTRYGDYAVADGKWYGRTPGRDFHKLTTNEQDDLICIIKKNQKEEEEDER